MRKLLLSVLMGIVVLAAGCGRNLDPTCGQKEVDVSFDMDVAQSATKAYGDGKTVNTVHVYAYLWIPLPVAWLILIRLLTVRIARRRLLL